MRRLEIVNANKSQLAIQREILRSEESRYDHRLHGVLMVGRGMSCGEVADWLGQDTTTVERWVKRFIADFRVLGRTLMDWLFEFKAEAFVL